MPETAANHAAEPYSLSTGESGAWEGEDRENARGRRRSSGTPAAARSKDGDGCQIRPRSLGEDDAFSQPRRQASHASIHPTQLQHAASATKPTKQSQQQSHQSITPSQHATATHLPTRASPGARNEVVLPADDTRAVPQRQTIGLLRQRGADADGVAALLEAASKGTLDRRCSGDVCGVRSPFRKGLRKSAGAGMTASRVVGTSPVGRDRRQHTKTLWWQPDAPARTTRLLSALAAGHHTIACLAASSRPCCGRFVALVNPGAECSQRVGVLSLVRRGAC